MKLRITGTNEERAKMLQLLRDTGYEFPDPAKLYAADDLREKTIYVDIPRGPPITLSNLQDWQVIDQCNNFTTKAGLAREFGISFEVAEEILDRLTDSGALLKWVVDNKRYEYLDARYARFVERTCGNCDARDGWGECCLDVRDGYCKVKAKACDRFTPARHGFYNIINEQNYSKIKEEN